MSPVTTRSRKRSRLLSTPIPEVSPATANRPSVNSIQANARERPKLDLSASRQTGSTYCINRDTANRVSVTPHVATCESIDPGSQLLQPTNLLDNFLDPDADPNESVSTVGSGQESIGNPDGSGAASVPETDSPLQPEEVFFQVDHGETNPHVLLEGVDATLYSEYSDSERECYCDCLLCSGCKSKSESCPKHPGIFCDGPCNRYMHLQCCGLSHMHDGEEPPSYFAVNKLEPENPIPISCGSTQHSNGPIPWYCIACKPVEDIEALQTKPFIVLENIINSSGRHHHPFRGTALLLLCKRLGIPPEWIHHEDPHFNAEVDRIFRQMRKKVWDICGEYRNLVPPNLFDSILDNHPFPYPPVKPMEKLLQQDMALYGRRFELSLLCFVIKSCACCGQTKPFYVDPCNKVESQHRSATGMRAKFKRSHLASQYSDAWQCTGIDCGCNGGQYFLPTYSKHKEFYESNHIATMETAMGNGSLSQVEVCHECRKEFQTGKEEKFQLARKFSIGNGFGVEPKLSDQPELIQELHSLLDNCTPAEEAAIRQITPLVSIARLKHGNIGSKGTISCVSQESTLLSVLPRLPSECKTVVIMRQGTHNGQATNLPSFSFRKAVIHRILEILHSINHPAFDFTLSQENLAQWPEEGNLFDMEGTLRIPEVTEEETGADDTIPVAMRHFDVDGGDMGPAPLQNDTHDEVFEGAVPLGKEANFKADALDAITAFQETVESLQNNLQSSGNSTAPDIDNDDTQSLARVGRDGNSLDSEADSNHLSSPDQLQYPSLSCNSSVTPGNGHVTVQVSATPSDMFIPSVETVDEDGNSLGSVADPNLLQSPVQQNDVTIAGSQAHLQQATHLPTGDFVNMMSTPYAWTRAFPTVFRVFFDASDNSYKVYGDITGLHRELREIGVSPHEWAKYIMWVNHGRAARHPIFPLVLSNELFRRSVYSQARVSLSLNADFDPNDPVEKLVKEDLCDVKKAKDLATRVNHHVGNVPGTDQYFKSVKNKFTATHFHHGYTNNLPLSAFHTGSLAEFHDPFLRHLLSSYSSLICGEGTQDILNNDRAFGKFMNECKHIVTHYFVAKMEIWLDVFLSHVIGLVEFNGCNEFAKGRGAIHAHLLLYCENNGFLALGELMDQLSQDIDLLMRDLDNTIRQMEEEQGVEPGKSCTLDKSPKSGIESRRTFLCRTAAGLTIFRNYEKQLEATKSKKLSENVSAVMDQHFSVSASHVGRAPSDFPAPAGRKDLGYRSSSDGMQFRTNILEKKELRKFKFTEEHRLYDRQCNILNHCLNHRCSNYCWKEEVLHLKYNPAQHQQDNPYITDWITNNDGAVTHVKLRYWKCRMGFGNKLVYPRGGPGSSDYTGGAACVRVSNVDFDKNGMPKYHASRNHPTIVQEPISMLYWGANADLQVFLTNRTSFASFKARHDKEEPSNNATQSTEATNVSNAGGPVLSSRDDGGDSSSENDSIANATKVSATARFGADYEEYLQNLAVNGASGLDQFTGSEGVLYYTCGYSCKGHSNSSEWNSTFRACADAAEKETPIRKVVSKFCTNIAKKRNISRDEASFVLAGGKYTISSSFVRACSVSSIDLSELSPEKDGDSGNSGGNSFKLSSLRKSYTDYVSTKPVYEVHLNFYQFVAKKYKCVPNFFGYQNIPCWPMDEDFAKWTLFFFVPHDGKSLRPVEDSYAKRLEAELHHPQFPPSLLARLLRLKNKYTVKVDDEVAIPVEGGDNVSPTVQRENTDYDDVAAVADGVVDDTSINMDGQGIDFDDVDFPPPSPSHNWSLDFEPDAISWLHDLKKKFYSGGVVDDELGGAFRETLYRPENAQGETQRLIIGAFLLHIREWMSYFNSVAANPDGPHEEIEMELPPCVRCYIQGNPGSGKSFVIHTISNILFNLLGSLKNLMKVAPTGCASALIHGCTTTRGNHVPCGKKLFKVPTFTAIGSTTKLTNLIAQLEALYVMIYDEHSMENRSTWAWKQNNCCVFRQELPSPLPKQLRERSFGGIPIVMSFGDCHQIPPVTGQPHYSKKKGKAQSSDSIGMTVFNNFINSPDPDAEVSYCFLMDSIFRQDDASYHNIIMKMRSGEMGRPEADKLLERELSNLPEEERKEFEKHALYVVPTWKDALPIVKKYMISLGHDIAKVGCRINPGRVDHISKECPLPKTNAFCAGAVVMLLTNFVVEFNLYNGAVGVIESVVYENADGPNSSDLPVFVMVDFPDVVIPEEDQYDPDNPTAIPIPLVTVRCENNCCSMTTIPLRVCKAITIHKCQGISIGNGEKWSKIVIVLPGSNSRLRAPGLECVAISRAKAFSDMAFMETEKHEINRARFIKIGRSKAYEDRNDFEKVRLRPHIDRTKQTLVALITSQDVDEDKCFEGGYWELIGWYRNTIDNSQ